MKASCSVVHSIHGRVRLRVEAVRLFSEVPDALSEFLGRQPGVEHVRLNLRCRSVVISGQFDGRGAEQFLSAVEQFTRDLLRNRGNGHALCAAAPRSNGSGRPAWLAETIGAVRRLTGFFHRIERAPSDRKAADSRRRLLLAPAGSSRKGGVPAPWLSSEMSCDAWHAVPGELALRCLRVGCGEGLSWEEAHGRLDAVGPNHLARIPRRSGLKIFVEQFLSVPVAMLAASAVVCVATGGIADAVAILAVVSINAGIGYVTESHSETTIASLREVQQPLATVIRSGRRCEIAVELVVPGDLLVLCPGTAVAADGRVLLAERLTIDESSLTGESLPVAKQTGTLDSRAALRDRVNMVYRGTVVTGGSGLAVVVATGGDTEIGRIQRLVGQAESPETPMERQLRQMGTLLGVSSGLICAGVFAVGVWRGYSLLDMLKSAISLAVAAVPEGLPMVATTTLALGVNRMRRHKVQVRRLDAVESLGSVQVFCFDKTGTITVNRMQAVAVFVGGESFAVTDRGWVDGNGHRCPLNRSDVFWLLASGVLCNETVVREDRNGPELIGSPTETALVQLALDAGLDVPSVRREYPLQRVEYRTEECPIMSSQHASSDGRRVLAVKGRPSEVLGLCRWQLAGDRRVELDDEDRARIQDENNRLAGQALRLLGVAYREGNGQEHHGEGQLTWLGLVGIADPVRTGVKDLIQVFHRAGIRTIMITGDQSATAYAVGKQVDLSGGEPMEMIESAVLDKISPEVMKGLAQRMHVFSAVSPSHKLQIVAALQRAGLVVAMTGDGINDGPALKAADIGVAMGSHGTEVARMTADVVLEEDNLETMIVAIRQGRAIYGNTRHAIHYLLSTNLSEILVMFGGVAAGLGQPLSPMQLLWINLISDVFPVITLATQPAAGDVMELPPRDSHEPLVNSSDLLRVGMQSAVLGSGSLAAYGWAIARYGLGPRAGTIAFTSLATSQILHMLSARSRQHTLVSRGGPPLSRSILGAVAAGLGIQAVAAFAPPVRRLLGTVAMSPLDVGVSLLGAVGPLLVNEGLKAFASRRALPALPSPVGRVGGPPAEPNDVGPGGEPVPIPALQVA